MVRMRCCALPRPLLRIGLCWSCAHRALSPGSFSHCHQNEAGAALCCFPAAHEFSGAVREHPIGALKLVAALLAGLGMCPLAMALSRCVVLYSPA